MRKLASSPDIRTVILIARYALYIEGHSEGDTIGAPDLFETDNSGKELDLEGRRTLFERQFNATIDRLIAAGKRVVLVYPVPEAGFDVSSAVVRLLIEHRDPGRLASSFSSYDHRQSMIFAMLDRMGQRSEVLRVYPHKRLCDTRCCIVYAGGLPLYSDNNHLSEAGAHFAQPELERIFATEEDLQAMPRAAQAQVPCL
jgi:hypothetical protein